jgi:hypothetical protein
MTSCTGLSDFTDIGGDGMTSLLPCGELVLEETGNTESAFSTTDGDSFAGRALSTTIRVRNLFLFYACGRELVVLDQARPELS